MTRIRSRGKGKQDPVLGVPVVPLSDVRNLVPAEQHPFVEKLLIFYPDLPTICEGTMDESSSIDELTQHILYFYPGDAGGACWNVFEPTEGVGLSHDTYANEAAVQFLGLCEALHTFPCSFFEHQNDRSREIQFGNSTIIFCPLEQGGEIMAVVQVSTGSSALAVRTSIQQSHAIFCLLRGGGVLPRLQSSLRVQDAQHKVRDNASFFDMSMRLLQRTVDNGVSPDLSGAAAIQYESPPQESISTISKCNKESLVDSLVHDGCIFPGMKSLYLLRKQIRQKTSTLSKLSALLELKRNSIEEEVERITLNLEQLRLLLPITSLRRDLTAHYDDFLQQASLSNHCLVELLPCPIDAPSCSASLSVPGSANIRQTIRSLLKQSCQATEATGPHLVAISAFYRGSLLFNESLLDLEENSVSRGVPHETACDIMRYMTHYEQRMQLQPSKQLPLRLCRRATSTSRLQQNIQDSLLQLNLSDRTVMETEPQELVAFGSYLSSPPLSMLNIADELYDISDSSLGNVWTPMFYVLVDDRYFPVKVAMFTVKDVTFLVYVDAGELVVSLESFEKSANALYEDYFSGVAFPPPPEAMAARSLTVEDGSDVEGQEPFAELLTKISWILSVCVDEATPVADGSVPTTNSPSPEKGVDIVYIDRNKDEVVFQLNKSERSERSAKGVRGQSKERDECDDGLLPSDLRHQLLSRLPSDAVDAFDDMMNEIHGKQDNNGSEICTFLPHGWVWAASTGSRELYMVFDPSEHGTINDVEQAGERVRQYYFNQVVTEFA